jgi:hypothetical protein
MSTLQPEYLRASVRKPVSPFEVKAGTIIPAVMLIAINSNLPGQITGQVRKNVYDSDTGEHLLISQGTRPVGLYDHHVVYGQQPALITWKRLLLPNGSSLSLRDGMPGTDAVGAAGFHDQVNSQYFRVFGNALLLSLIGAGVQPSHRGQRPRRRRRPAVRLDGVGVHSPRHDLGADARCPPRLPLQRDGDTGRHLPGSVPGGDQPMKLKRVRVLSSVKLAGRVSGELNETLSAYAKYYRDVHEEAIELWPLVAHILQTFVDDDRAFQMWRRQTNRASTDALVGPRNGTRTESGNGQR